MYCSHDKISKVCEAIDKRTKKHKAYKFFKCKFCGLIFIDPEPSKAILRKIYSYKEKQVHPNPIISTFYNKIEIFKWIVRGMTKINVHLRVKAVESASTDGRILDVGCGPGDFLYSLRRRGFELYGNELSEKAAKVARVKLKKTGARICNAELTKCGYESNFFDVVTLWHVLEHIPNADETVQEIARILKPGGALIIELPHGNSLTMTLFKQYWTLLLIPEHLHFWTELSFKKLFDKSNLELRRVSFPFLFPFVFLSSLLNALRGDSVSVHKALFIVVVIIFLPVSLLFSLFTSLIKRGDIIRVVAEKPLSL